MKYWLTTLVLAILFASYGISIRQNHIYKDEVREFLIGESIFLKDGKENVTAYSEVLAIIHNSIALKAKPRVTDKPESLRFTFESLFTKDSSWAIELGKENGGYTLLSIEGVENYQNLVNCAAQP